MKIGFIGVGAMAKALISGMLKAKYVSPNNILVHSAHKSNYESFANKNHLTAVDSNMDVAARSDVVVLAVIPAIAAEVITEIRSELSNKQALVSIISGFSLAMLTDLTNDNQPILRSLPNINSAYESGMTAIASNQSLADNPELSDQAIGIFDCSGVVNEMPEEQFATFSAISGSATAYVDFFIDALSRAGVKYGLSKDVATKIAAQTTLGSAQSLLKSGDSPAEMIDKVCSPGGDTIAGILAMEEAGFLNSVVKGIDATITKSTGNA